MTSKRPAKPYLEVKNWEELQHYGKSRNAIWIKFYASLLDDIDGFLELDEVTQCHLSKIWLIALRQKNRIPFRLAWIEREITAQSHVDFTRLILDGWLIPRHISEVDIEAEIEINRSRPTLDSNPRYQPSIASEEKRREEKKRDTTSISVKGDPPNPKAGSPLAAAPGRKVPSLTQGREP